MKTKLTSQTTRAGLALVVISFLLSLVPFQGKNLTTSKERTTAQTEVVVAGKKSQKRAFSFSLFSAESPSVKAVPIQLAEIHSIRAKVSIKHFARNLVPLRRHSLLTAVFISETDDHIIA